MLDFGLRRSKQLSLEAHALFQSDIWYEPRCPCCVTSLQVNCRHRQGTGQAALNPSCSASPVHSARSFCTSSKSQSRLATSFKFTEAEEGINTATASKCTRGAFSTACRQRRSDEPCREPSHSEMLHTNLTPACKDAQPPLPTASAKRQGLLLL